MDGLTPKQRRVLDFIRKHIAAHGSSPSYREIGSVAGSVSNAHRYVHILITRGHLDGRARRARTITVAEDRQ